MFVFLLISTSTTLFATSWVVDATTTTAYTSPSPYDNYSDITTTLSISGAAALEVTISGETESNYDFLYITDESGNTQSFDGTLNETITIIGSSITLRFSSDYSVTRDGVTISIVSTSVPIDPEVCPGTVLPTLDGTSVSAVDNYSNVNLPPNTTYYYNFTPTASGTIQVDTSANKTYNSLYILDGCGSTLWSATNNSNDKSSPEIDVTAGQLIVIAFERRYTTDITVDIDFTYTVISTVITAVNDNWSIQANTPLSANVITNDTGSNINVIATTQPNDGVVVMQADGSFVYTPNTDFTGTSIFTYTITNDGGTTTSVATVSITVSTAILNAVDDTYNTLAGTAISGNLLGNDSGTGITLTSNTVLAPDRGTLSISPNGDFTYTPDSNESGIDTFSYTITDVNGDTDDANVTINIETDFTEGVYLDFLLINPPNTRNVIGNYKIAGNTVLCLTANTTGYGGECTDDSSVTSNLRVSKYLDIDNDGGTWNSTSSYIEFDAPYDPARGIVWAGLFWGGRISSDDDRPIRYAIENGSNSFSTVEVGAGGSVGAIDIETLGAPNIKLKIDTGTYSDILASKFHTSPGSGGETYAAFADVSAVLQSANLGLGKHTFTVANLTTMEGRENSPGAFGGWSLVVIYAEDYTNGKPRNISIYNGFIDIGTSNNPIEISGFKLPTSGNVQAQLSVFSGEGEYLYGRRNGNTNSDWMKISDSVNSGYQYMPGKTEGDHLGNRDNMFDALLDNILRDTIPGEFNNLTSNNVGVDVDNYDVSSLMTGYRDADENISSIYIQMFSDNDYITPSMMAFSAELYVPELCYDYTLDIDGHVLTSENNEIKTPFGGFGQDLTTVIYLKSLEGDIPLSDININYSILDTSQLQYDYQNCSTEISETGEYDYSDACLYTHSASNSGFSMYIGTGKTNSSGGIINALENRYIKFDTEFQASTVSTAFTFSVDYTVDYGSGAVPLRKEFSVADLCEPINSGFFPQLGYFNVTDSTNTINQWNLYTQTANRAFNLKLYAYDASNPTQAIANDLNLTVEVEMIRADNFNRDANTACNDEHSILADVPSKFVDFNQSKTADLSYAGSDINLAYRSTAMRVWYLTDISGDGFLTDNHHCTRNNQDECIVLYNRDYTSGGKCANECRTNLSTGNCYDCLRSYYGRKVCSRDNFSIRPESFLTQIRDSNQSEDITQTNIQIADSTTTSAAFSIVAGYEYRFDINATNHLNNNATPRYRQHFEPGSNIHRVSMEWFPDGHTVTNCNDTEDKNISLNIFNGSSVNFHAQTSYLDKVDQIGKYRFSVYDQNWTSADWDDDQMTHHSLNDPITGMNFANYYIEGNDCTYDSTAVFPVENPTINPRPGCKISSVHTNADTGTEYMFLYAQYYPYTFNVNGLSIGAGSSNDKNFVYINSLDSNLYPNGVDENMSFNIQGTFTATGKNGLPVSNFVENCYAESIDMSLYQHYNHSLPSNVNFMTYDLIDYNTTDSDVIIRPREQADFSQANLATTSPLIPLVIDQGAQFFKKDMNGSITMDLGYNFARTNDTPLNPRLVTMKDFNITYTTQPATVYVDLQTDYKIFGNKDIDQNVTFLYARAKPGQLFYDDVTNANIITPVSVVVYCDLGYTVCQNRGIMALLAQTNETSWWKSWDHTNTDGNIELVSTPTSALASTSVSIINEGEDRTINVSRGTATLPVVIPVNLVVNDPDNPPAPANYTDRWFIYNPESPILAPSPFYRVRFIGGSGWAGQGDTGYVVGGQSNVKKNKRMEW